MQFKKADVMNIAIKKKRMNGRIKGLVPIFKDDKVSVILFIN